MSQKKYRWSNPHEWLQEAVAKKQINTNDLLTLINQSVDGDQIQDLFQNDMDKDGYFDEVKEDNNGSDLV